MCQRRRRSARYRPFTRLRPVKAATLVPAISAGRRSDLRDMAGEWEVENSNWGYGRVEGRKGAEWDQAIWSLPLLAMRARRGTAINVTAKTKMEAAMKARRPWWMSSKRSLAATKARMA